MSAATQLELGYESDKEYAARMLPKLIEVARAIAIGRVDRRVTAANLRKVATARGILTGAEKGRRLSFIHEVFPKAGFQPTDAFERSDIPQSNRNLGRVWYLPQPESHAT